MIATIWEVWNDKDGDLNKGNDIFVRLFLLFLDATAIMLLTFKNWLLCFLLATSINFLLFDYLIAYVLIRNKVIEVPGAHWFSYTGKKGWFDNLKLWKFASPWIRFGIKLAYLIISLVLFFTL